ncbi:MAG: hypothetical protein M5U26_25165 [Planctomycetota bacterium]|nr:hypothetical protein [Planctomycetota bacterium]
MALARTCCRTALLAALLAAGPACVAQEDPARSALEAQLLNLNHPDFDTRTAAMEALVVAGPDAWDWLRRRRAGAPDLETACRMDEILRGPQVSGRCLDEWAAALRAPDEGPRVAALAVLETAGTRALPVLPSLLADPDLQLRYAGCWLAANLGERARSLAPLVARELARALKEPAAAAGFHDPCAAWLPVYLKPLVTRAGGEPWCHYYLGGREACRFAAQADIEEGLCTLRPALEPRAVVCPFGPADPREDRSQLWGVYDALERLRRAEWTDRAVDPALHLRMLVYVLERLGPGAEGQALIRRWRDGGAVNPLVQQALGAMAGP